MKEKQVFDYKEPFQAPYMVREITKKFRLRNAVSGQSIFVAGITFFITGLVFYPLLGFDKWLVCLCIFIPFGMVELFNRVEPDGKKVPVFLWDYVQFVFKYQWGKKSIQQAELLHIRTTKMSYEKETLASLQVKKR